MFKHGFYDENIIVLKIDGKDEYAFLVNEVEYEKELNTIYAISEFLKNKYLNPIISIMDKTETTNSLESIINPNYEILDTSIFFSLFHGKIKEFTLEFIDGEKAKIFEVQKTGQSYFEISPKNFWGKSSLYLYESFESCANALYYLTKNGKVLKDGFLKKY